MAAYTELHYTALVMDQNGKGSRGEIEGCIAAVWLYMRECKESEREDPWIDMDETTAVLIYTRFETENHISRIGFPHVNRK